MNTNTLSDTVTVNNIEYIRADQVNVAPTTKQIVVLQRGWIVVGDVAKTETEITIDNASVVRRWGTSKGLGELAENGPLPNTVLDPCPLVTVHPLAVVMYMNVNEHRWL